MNATNDTMPDALRQLLVDAAATLENLTDFPYVTEENDEAREGVRLAGRLRDAAAGKPVVRSWDVWIDTGVNVEMPGDVDPNTDDGVAAIKEAATAKLLDAIEEGSFNIRCEEHCGG